MKVEGWHWKEWWAELTGTAVLLFLVVTARFWVGRVWGPPVSQTPVHWAVLWIYSAGSAAAAVLVSGRRPVTGELFHDPAIECHMRCAFPDPIEPPTSADEVSAVA